MGTKSIHEGPLPKSPPHNSITLGAGILFIFSTCELGPGHFIQTIAMAFNFESSGFKDTNEMQYFSHLNIARYISGKKWLMFR